MNKTISVLDAISTAKESLFALFWKGFTHAFSFLTQKSQLKPAIYTNLDSAWCPMIINRIAFAGKKYSGKTEALETIFDLLDGQADIISTSETLIELLGSQTGISKSEIKQNKEKYRQKLQALGDSIEKEAPAGVLDAAFDRTPARAFHLIDSVRRSSEIWYLKKKPGTLFILLETDPDIRLIRGGDTNDTHPTEHQAYNALKAQALTGDPYVVILENNGTPEELRNNLSCLLDKLGLLPEAKV